MAVFIEKPPFTSSNCYETMKKTSILMKLGTNVDWTIPSVTFLLPWQMGERLKMAKNHYFALFFFSIKTDFKVLQLLNQLR
jgi:hypothetical protein